MADADVCRELRDLKMLIVLQLLNAGVKQRQIAAALSISEASMSRMLPKGLGVALKNKRADAE